MPYVALAPAVLARFFGLPCFVRFTGAAPCQPAWFDRANIANGNTNVVSSTIRLKRFIKHHHNRGTHRLYRLRVTKLLWLPSSRNYLHLPLRTAGHRLQPSLFSGYSRRLDAIRRTDLLDRLRQIIAHCALR